ncbi:fibrohexamerin-like [Anticarsia gemmatalis]|uniref:fibrohexamerin-like n=1 Tax=Anticarsia gemmatalis TaxID=129554 RepID=UPI003F76CB9D
MKYLPAFLLLFVCGSQAFDFQNDDSDFDDSSKEQPCDEHDMSCIKHFFARHSHCSPVSGNPPDSYYMKNLTIDVPYANGTTELKNLQIKGLNSGKVENFFINKKSNVLVFEVVFSRIMLYSPSAKLIYYRKGKDPLTGTDYAKIEQKNLSLTFTIQYSHDFRISQGHVYSAVSGARYKIGPRGDNVVGAELARQIWKDDFGLAMREAMVAEGPELFHAYFKTTICSSSYH